MSQRKERQLIIVLVNYVSSSNPITLENKVHYYLGITAMSAVLMVITMLVMVDLTICPSST